MMEVFKNQEFGSIRVWQEAGKTLFCASDVAIALGYVNPYAAVKRHCRGPLTKREEVVQKVNQYGDTGEQVVLSDVAQVSILLRRYSNNLNQYAKRTNEMECSVQCGYNTHSASGFFRENAF